MLMIGPLGPLVARSRVVVIEEEKTRTCKNGVVDLL